MNQLLQSGKDLITNKRAAIEYAIESILDEKYRV